MNNIRQSETKRLHLRMFEGADIDFTYSHFSNASVSDYLYDNEPPTSVDEAREILEWCMVWTCLVLMDND
jgi:RimJ/RimL family protein N-acetyltransferase